ncbi:hypothetical protein Hanom_Chr06g00550641 [Helianthus anomalus]
MNVRRRSHYQLYHPPLLAQANQISTGNQVTCEWRVMYRERALFEETKRRLGVDEKLFQQAKAQLT